MKPISLLLICFIALLFSCQQKPKEVFQYYSTGEVARKHFVIKDKKEGAMTEYYKDGKVKSERMFENDQEVGKSTFYYPSGSIKEAMYHDQGKMHGGDTVFYESGKPQFLRTWNHGLMDGYMRKWDENGGLTYEAKYANDKLVEVKGEAIVPDTSIVQ